ncbi:MAG: alpha/beta hydrolase [Dehalococcoidia bacterium]
MFEGFTTRDIPTEGNQIFVRTAGSGPPVLLIHGYPQTGAMWHKVAPVLAERFSVVVPDLRGYGRSGKPQGGGDYAAYSKRTMASELVAVMRTLGHERFTVAGHDRGGRVAYRMAFDHPDVVTRVATLDIVPTAVQWKRLDRLGGLGGYHWYFLAQPEPLPEKLIAADPLYYLHSCLARWAGRGFEFDAEAMAEYDRSFSDPATVHGSCEDYRAGARIDVEIDEADAAAGRKIQQPMLALWGGARGQRDDLPVWREWARDVRGRALDCGHFLPEEAPEATAAELLAFFAS